MNIACRRRGEEMAVRDFDDCGKFPFVPPYRLSPCSVPREAEIYGLHQEVPHPLILWLALLMQRA